jgi:hypothetical protein
VSCAELGSVTLDSAANTVATLAEARELLGY